MLCRPPGVTFATKTTLQSTAPGQWNGEIPLVHYKTSSISVNASQQRSAFVSRSCSVLQEVEPFVSCNSKVDPEHFIAACTNLLCNYPDVDGLYCHVLETFARTCKIEDWRDAFGCCKTLMHSFLSQLVHLPFQQMLWMWLNDVLFSVCQLLLFVWTTAAVSMSFVESVRRAPPLVSAAPCSLCRTNLPSLTVGRVTESFKNTQSYLKIPSAVFSSCMISGDPTVCQHNSASVILIACLLVEEGFDVTALRLNDGNCTGRKDKVTNTIRFSFSDSEKCGGEIIVGFTFIHSSSGTVAYLSFSPVFY